MRGWLVALVMLAGCSAPASMDPEQPTVETPTAATGLAVVVADISGGPNFYHEAHRRPTWTDHPSLRIPGFPPDAPSLNLTFGPDYDAGVAADQAEWDAMTPGLYWVPGTNLLWYYESFYEGERENVPHSATHSVGTAGAVSLACPDCYVLVVWTGKADLGRGLDIVTESFPWVDVVEQTTSTGSGGGHDEAALALWRTGRHFVAGSSNTPVTGTAGGLSPGYQPDKTLPPWIVSVGGSHPECNAVEAQSGAPAEIVADFQQELPAPRSTTETVTISGVSFSAPLVAGALGQALLDVRREAGALRDEGILWAGTSRPGTPLEDGILTHEELRDALHAAATWFTPESFDAACAASRANEYQTPLPAPAQPWTKMGWGNVDTETGKRAALILLGSEPAPDKEAARPYMDAYHAARVSLYGEP